MRSTRSTHEHDTQRFTDRKKDAKLGGGIGQEPKRDPEGCHFKDPSLSCVFTPVDILPMQLADCKKCTFLSDRNGEEENEEEEG